MNQQSDSIFEDEVRRLARALWPSPDAQGAAIIEGQERDGVFFTEESIHVVEATTSRQKQKVLDDSRKIRNAGKALSPSAGHRTITGWIITKKEPTADQRSVLRKEDNVRLISFSEFQSKLIDARGYLSARSDQYFGSVRDPASENPVPGVDFIPPDFYQPDCSTLWNYKSITPSALQGSRVTIIGEYGAGKSMTLRQIFFDTRQRHLSNKITQFPVYINLRDHAGQTYPSEILERHARHIGFHSPNQLVRAWRAGYVLLLLDGFDELASTIPYGMTHELRQHRYQTMEGVRRLIQESSATTGIVICGRSHFFNSTSELRTALGLSNSDPLLDLTEFTPEQVSTYLCALGFSQAPPPWLPSRPLLLGYLVGSGTLAALAHDSPDLFDPEDGSTKAPGQCWHLLLDRITRREAQIEPGIEPNSIRKLLERIATYARRLESGLGPISVETLQSTFQEISGFPADSRGLTLLQRLPGLTTTSGNETTRHFVDREFAGACSAGDVVRFFEDPYNADPALYQSLEAPLPILGVEVAAFQLQDMVNRGIVKAATERAKKLHEKNVLLSDLVTISTEVGVSVEGPVTIANVTHQDMQLTSAFPDLSGVTYRECMFEQLYVEPMADGTTFPRFEKCYILRLEGRRSESDLPAAVFSECEVDEYSDAHSHTYAEISSDMPLMIRVAISILKKLYLQSGGGRRESALFRGLDHHGRTLVPNVIRILERHGLARPSGLTTTGGETIWRPVPSEARRARELISAPSTSDDIALKDLQED